MGLFLIVNWCRAVVGRCGGRNILGDNSRFGVFNSRLGRRKFPVMLPRELARKGMIRLTVFVAPTMVLGSNRRNSHYNGKNRDLPSPGNAKPEVEGIGRRGLPRCPRVSVATDWNRYGPGGVFVGMTTGL
jgi:hypothetical protein